MTSLNDHANTDSNELSIDELNAKWDALENDSEFKANPFWERIAAIGNVVPQSEWRKHLPILRQSVIRLTRDLRSDENTLIIPQTSEQFEQAFDFYQRRLDKEYSLTDCSSMQIMRQFEIFEILTFDRHFQQECFRALLRE